MLILRIFNQYLYTYIPSRVKQPQYILISTLIPTARQACLTIDENRIQDEREILFLYPYTGDTDVTPLRPHPTPGGAGPRAHGHAAPDLLPDDRAHANPAKHTHRYPPCQRQQRYGWGASR